MSLFSFQRRRSFQAISACAFALGVLSLPVLWPHPSQAERGHLSVQQSGESTDLPVKSKSPNSVPGEILVRFRSESAVAKSKQRSELSIEESGRELSVQLESLSQGPEIVEGLRLARVDSEDTARAIAALRARPDVLY